MVYWFRRRRLTRRRRQNGPPGGTGMKGALDMRFLAAGGVNLDILGQPLCDLKLRDSNPGTVTLRAGGVCHNIALELVRQGHTVHLVTCLGSGPAGHLLENLCRDEGIDLSHSLCTSGAPGMYLCLHEHTGDMLCAVNDMRTLEALTPQEILDRLGKMPPADALVLDCNLREDTLCAAAAFARGRLPLFLDPVSTFKAPRCRRILRYLDILKPNRMEAEALTGFPNPADSARALVDLGVRRVFVSLGAEGVYYADASGGGLCPAVPLDFGTPLTGAGDALCGGILLAYLQRRSTAECAAHGVRCAARKLREAARQT